MTVSEDCKLVADWMREPDHAEKFTFNDLNDWLDRRPVAEVARLTAALSDQAGEAKEPVEVRNKNDVIDEIIIQGGTVHIEQMSADGWFMGVNAADGSYWQFWFGSKNRKSHVEFRHTETTPAPSSTAGEGK
jgi:hypothetical protein